MKRFSPNPATSAAPPRVESREHDCVERREPPLPLPASDDRHFRGMHEVKLAEHAVFEESRVVAEAIREVSGHGTDRFEPHPLWEALKRLVPNEHYKLDVGEGIALAHHKRAEHQRAHQALIVAARLSKAIDPSQLKHNHQFPCSFGNIGGFHLPIVAHHPPQTMLAS